MPHSGPFYEVGRYRARLGGHAVVEKPAGPQLVLKFRILGVYDNTGQVVDCTGYERTFYRVMNDNTMKFAVDELKALGFSAAKFADLDPSSEDAFSFDGLEVDMWCSHRPDKDGNVRENWAPAKQGGSSEIEGKRVEKSALRKLDSMFGKALKGNQPPARREPQPAAALAQQGVSDDDVPF